MKQFFEVHCHERALYFIFFSKLVLLKYQVRNIYALSAQQVINKYAKWGFQEHQKLNFFVERRGGLSYYALFDLAKNYNGAK